MTTAAPITKRRERIKGFSYFLSLAVGIVAGSVATLIYQDVSGEQVTVYAFSDSPDLPYRCVVIQEIRSPETACPWYTIAIQETESGAAPSRLRPIAGETCTFNNDSSGAGAVEFHWSGNRVTVTFSMLSRGNLVGTVIDRTQAWAWEPPPPTTGPAR